VRVYLSFLWSSFNFSLTFLFFLMFHSGLGRERTFLPLPPLPVRHLLVSSCDHLDGVFSFPPVDSPTFYENYPLNFVE